MAQPRSRSETCNDNTNLDGSQHKPQCNKGDLFPFPGFTINNQTDTQDYTPITKIPCESVLKSSNSAKSTQESSSRSSTTTKTPPVEPSVSPEIQTSLYRSILVSGAAPSTCYGAGHVISGITDRRKCKARGILSAGHSISTPFKQGITKDSNNLFSYGKTGQEIYKETSPSLIPFPTEASISWHLSPSYVHKNDVVAGTPQEERTLSLDFNGDCSPFSADLSSGNVMQTPNSNSSLQDIQFKSKLDQATGVLEHESLLSPKDTSSSPWDPPRLSSEFSDLSPPSNTTSVNMSESQMRISWRDELIGTFDKDDLDCCRLLSDEEIEADDGLLKSTTFLEDQNEKETSFPTKINICEESICNDDGGLTASADSDWSQHYKNQSFEL